MKAIPCCGQPSSHVSRYARIDEDESDLVCIVSDPT